MCKSNASMTNLLMFENCVVSGALHKHWCKSHVSWKMSLMDILQVLAALASAVFLLATNGESIQIYGYFSAVISNHVTLCAVDNEWPPQSIAVRSSGQCASLCRHTPCCVMFNVVSGPAGGSINCQTFNHTPRSVKVVSGCSAYAVRLFETALPCRQYSHWQIVLGLDFQ
jgi:hypothetical protein